MSNTHDRSSGHVNGPSKGPLRHSALHTPCGHDAHISSANFLAVLRSPLSRLEYPRGYYSIFREKVLTHFSKPGRKFATTRIGRNIKREVLAEHLARLGKRLGDVPEFAAYAIADGIKRAFTRFGKWVRTTVAPAMEKPGNEIVKLLPGFAELFDTYDE